MRLLPALILLASLATAPACAADAIGFRLLALPGTAEHRALDVALWYPAADSATPPTMLGDNAAFVGRAVVRDAPAAPGHWPLVVISHGLGGNWTNQIWLAGDLVRHGFVVAAPNHPGTTSRDLRPLASAPLWERPRDISHVIDALLAEPTASGMIAPQRVGIIGHSLGGWTAIEIAGGRFDPRRFDADCAVQSDLAACKYASQPDGDTGRRATDAAMLTRSWKDPRVKAVVTLDLGLARGFDPASLAAIDIPVLVVAAGRHTADMPAALESGFLVAHLPGGTPFVAIDDAAHFSFLPVCKAGAAALLEADHPGDGIICQDGNGRDRMAIHDQVAATVIPFLARSLQSD
ncbi:MAG: hypothetical protein P4M00_22995 [Azospirillaceae bacterium]|nr:hypothetical protein [Azospirillaceae bacterium]